MADLGGCTIERAVPSLVLKGEKRDISVLSVRLRGTSEIEKKKLLKMMGDKICSYKAVLSDTNEGILALFNVSAKQFKHEIEAVKASIDIAEEAKKLNLNLGIGINRGEIVVLTEGNIARYTGLGDTINLAKKLSNKSLGEIFISEEAYDRTDGKINVVKAEKVSEELEQNVFAVTKVNERDKYRKYIDAFVRKTRDEERARQAR